MLRRSKWCSTSHLLCEWTRRSSNWQWRAIIEHSAIAASIFKLDGLLMDRRVDSVCSFERVLLKDVKPFRELGSLVLLRWIDHRLALAERFEVWPNGTAVRWNCKVWMSFEKARFNVIKDIFPNHEGYADILLTTHAPHSSSLELPTALTGLQCTYHAAATAAELADLATSISACDLCVQRQGVWVQKSATTGDIDAWKILAHGSGKQFEATSHMT